MAAPLQTQQSHQSQQAANQDTHASDDTASRWIDNLSKKIDLTADQKQKIRDTLKQNDNSVQSAWKNYAQAQMKAISLEAEMYAAIQDQMDAQQKQQFKTAQQKQQSEKAAGTYTSNKKTGNSANAGQSADQTDATQATNRNQKSDAYDKMAQRNSKQNADQQADSSDATGTYVEEVIIVPVEEVVYSVGLDDQQQAQCDAACHNYHQKLYKAYSDIQKYHNELVKQEASKIEAVEKILTKDQRTKLKQQRSPDSQSDSSDSKSNNTDSSSSNS